MKNLGKYLWGGLFIAAGLLFALNIADVISFNIWMVIFPVIIAAVGVSILINDKRNFAGYILILLGAALFIRRQFDINVDFKYIVAGVLVIIGFFIVFSSAKKRTQYSNNVDKDQFVFFGGKTDKITNPDFEGYNTFCMFGGHEIDMRGLEVTRDITISATALFGGITVFVPSNVNIIIKSLPIFGGSQNNTKNTENNIYTVYVNATVVFGGLEVRN